MSTFFQQTAQAMIAKHIDRFPLLKLDLSLIHNWTLPTMRMLEITEIVVF
ncbi:hypothetical protein MCC93_27920 [Morococcus cerebrosus]|uniref:Uncharacterized protein n=1 Tax=Morococcus cerebrosus TaxID=1056807 RepID=A0A0C1GVB7_9NEIS|nr:hypothetical protein [Morococcus cerebrosus]KIC05752.1 hypothetical protein MCC93_27920 [Morococcus cerebrosus]